MVAHLDLKPECFLFTDPFKPHTLNTCDAATHQLELVMPHSAVPLSNAAGRVGEPVGPDVFRKSVALMWQGCSVLLSFWSDAVCEYFPAEGVDSVERVWGWVSVASMALQQAC